MNQPSRGMCSPDGACSPLVRCLTSTALALSVISSGAAVMIYEFLAVRILQSQLGSLLEIWAAEITVCLAGLAIGYSIGGYIADRFRSWFPFGLVLAIAGLTALPMEPLAVMTCDWLFSDETASPAWWWPIMAAGVSTFTPILALGTVMPQAIRLHVRSLDKVGAGAGWIATISTIGSIVGVLLITFLLLPNFGVRATLLWVSVIVIALGVLMMACSLFARFRAAAPATAALVLLALFPREAAADILYDRYSAYHHILVEDTDGHRLLRFDRTRQTKMSLADPAEGGFEYADFFHVPMIFNPSAKNVLFVGLGGGTGPKAFLKYHPNVQIDAVEIDPAVVDVAKQYFAVPVDPRLSLSVSDGRVFLRRSKKRYDVIFMDAYGTGPYGLSLPYHLSTVEFFKIVRERLTNGGCMLYNVVETDRRAKKDRVQDLLTTMEQVFESVYVFKAQSSMNTVMIAVKVDLAELGNAPTPPLWPDSPAMAHPILPETIVEMTQALLDQGLITIPTLLQRVTQLSPAHSAPRTGTVLTDDFAPVDLAPRGE